MKKSIKYVICIIMAAMLMLLFSSSTSPLYEIYYGDYYNNTSSAAMLMGKAWSQGTILYKDLYGIGGSVFYLLQAVGWLLGGRNGVFVLQIINMSVFFLMMHKIYNHFFEEKVSWILIVMTFIAVAATITGGNSEEEFILSLSAVMFWITLKMLEDRKTECKYYFIMGILTGLTFMCKVTAGGIVYGLVLIVLLYLFRKAGGKEALKFLSSIIIGAALIVCPIVLYFQWNGALGEMIRGAFIHNIKLMFEDMNGFELIMRKVIKCVPAILLCMAGVVQLVKKSRIMGSSMLIIGMCLLLFSVTGKGYWNTYLLAVCCIPLVVGLIHKMIDGKKKILLIALCACCFVGVYSLPLKHYYEFVNNTDLSGYENMIIDLQYYQESNPDGKVFLVDIPAFVYLASDIIPEYKYSFLQEDYNEILPNVREELNEYVLNECDAPIIIVGSRGSMSEHIGDYSLMGAYYYERNIMAVYERLEEVGE